MPMRRRTPVMVVPRSQAYSSPRHDYGIDDSIHRADFLSNAVLEDTYDAAARSRGKDMDLLRNVNLAIGAVHSERADRARSVALEQPAPPRSARGASMPPGTFYHRSKVPPLSLPPAPLPTSGMRATRHQPASYNAAMLRARARSLDRGGTLGAGSPTAAAPIPTQQLWAHRPVTLRKDASLASRARTDPRNPYSAGLRRVASEPRLLERGEGSQHTYYYPALPASHKILYRVPGAGEKALSRHVYSHRGRFGPDSKPPRPSLAGFPQVYVPWNGPGPSNRSKAAIIGSKMEPEGKAGRRGPRSQYAQSKLREMHLDGIQRKYQ